MDFALLPRWLAFVSDLRMGRLHHVQGSGSDRTTQVGDLLSLSVSLRSIKVNRDTSFLKSLPLLEIICVLLCHLVRGVNCSYQSTPQSQRRDELGLCGWNVPLFCVGCYVEDFTIEPVTGRRGINQYTSQIGRFPVAVILFTTFPLLTRIVSFPVINWHNGYMYAVQRC